MKVITIGRNGDSNDIVVNDPKVSRNHLQIVMDDNGNVFVVDMASTNGTYVNGQRIAGQVALHQGDEVRIGSTVLPWMNYVQANQQQPQQPVSIPHTPVPQKNPKKNRTFIFVIVGAAVVLAAIGIGVALMISNSRKTEAEAEQLKADSIEAAQLKAEQEQKENEALQREVDSLWDVAKKAKTERERTAVEKRIKEIENRKAKADAEAKAKEERLKKAEAELKKAQADLNKTQSDLKKAEAARTEAERQNQQLKTAQQNGATAENVSSKSDVNPVNEKKTMTPSQLKKKFNSLLDDNKKNLRDFCIKKGYMDRTSMNLPERAKKNLQEKFNNMNDDQREKLVNEMEKYFNTKK